MPWQVPQALGGPVLAWELKREARQGWLQARYVYVALVVLEVIFLFPSLHQTHQHTRALPIEESVILVTV